MIGQSGGRSRGNRTGAGAKVRATQRERDLVDPPRDGQPHEELWAPDPDRNRMLAHAVTAVLLTVWLVLSVLGALAVADLLGIL